MENDGISSFHTDNNGRGTRFADQMEDAEVTREAYPDKFSAQIDATFSTKEARTPFMKPQ